MATAINKGTPNLLVLNETQENGLLLLSRMAKGQVISSTAFRNACEEIDRQYMREKNYTTEQWQARLSNMRGDSSKLQDVTVPIIMPQVESALVYMANVFCSGYPIFGVETDPSNAQAGIAMDAIMGENAVTAGWVRQMIMFFRDGLKYNWHGLENEWQQKNVYSVEGDTSGVGKVKSKTTIWNGNSLKRLNPYNTLWDIRVPLAEVHKRGEYAGYFEIHSRIDLLNWINDQPVRPSQNLIDRALQSGNVTSSIAGDSTQGYYMPLINPFPLMSPSEVGFMDWFNWSGLDGQNAGDATRGRAGMYERLRLYVRIVPRDYGLNTPGDDADVPQIWKLEIINNQVILFCDRQTNAHNFFPTVFGQPIEDGLGLQTKSFATNVQSMQEVATALANAYIATQRRSVSDRMFYNPMYVSHKNMKSTDPAAKIPVLPAAYGKPLNEVAYQIPFDDRQSPTLLSGVDRAVDWANSINGQNPAQQGQFVPGNKTQQEYSDTMGHGNGRNQLMAMETDAQIFTDIKTMMKLNILQYQQDGTVYSQGLKTEVNVDVTSLRNTAVNYKISDGMLPTDKLLNSDDFTVALQSISNSPTLGAGYNVADVFSYLMKQKRVDLTPFQKSQEQMMYEQQTSAWQQVAMEAIKAGQPPPPQPQPSQALQQEMAARQANGGVMPNSSPAAAALQTTTGNGKPVGPGIPGQPSSDGVAATRVGVGS